MKTTILIIRLTLLVIVIATGQSFSQSTTDTPSQSSHTDVEITAEDVVAKYLAAIGGIDAIKAMDSKKLVYWVHMFGRDAYRMERTWTRPNTVKTERAGSDTFTLTEGDRSWRVGPEGRRELPPSVAANIYRRSNIDGSLVDAAERGITLAYSGTVRFDMADLHHITATFTDGVQWEFFFDANTGLLRKMIEPSFFMMNDEISRGPDAHTFFYDYRAAGSILYPHYWIQSTDNHTHLFVVDEIQINP